MFNGRWLNEVSGGLEFGRGGCWKGAEGKRVWQTTLVAVVAVG